MPFKKKEYEPVSLQPDAPEQTTESPEAKGEAGRPPKGVTKERHQLSKFSTDSDVLDVWQRRLINPDGESMPTIRIKTPGMKLRWINTEQTARYSRATRFQGWVPVERDELVDEREIFGVTFTTEGYVCRGARQTGMLMKMPTSVWNAIQKKRAELNKASYQNLKAQMVSAGAQHIQEKMGNEFGDSVGRRAADQAAEGATHFKGNISFGEERIGSDEVGGFE